MKNPGLTAQSTEHRSSGGLLWPAALLIIGCIVALFPVAARAQASKVVVIHLDDTIQPISADYLKRGLDRAADMHAQAVLVEMNTPGGLLESMREMVKDILASPTPVIVYVGPSGSRAGSAGFFIMESADLAAMAPGTEAGAAHPVIEMGQVSDTMKQKILNDALAFLRSYVSIRDRNVNAAQAAVTDSKSYTANEAQELKLIDLIAPSDRALLDAIDGRIVKRFNGTSQALHTRNAEMVTVEENLRERVMDRLMDPNLAVLILLAGALLIYLEFHIPGTIVPGAVGTMMVLLALFSLNLLPVRYTSLGLILCALVLMVLEAKFPSHGVLALSGTAALVLGLMTLVAGPIPEMRVQWATALSAGLAFGLITTFLVRIAWRARRNKIMIGPEALVGAVGVSQQALAPQGQVLVHGELWLAESTTPIPAGETVKVRAVDGLKLLVDPVQQHVSA
ncbi:MAG TPA: nodulation protein NfeD [Acidobacteriaceae bacterium]|jgi:membrane-bound serine protease (ClpP class)|nr:nodulation protein NfeD [Acidobacteriaceae bacterium]